MKCLTKSSYNHFLGEYDLQIANWKMESIVKEPDSSDSDEEFYDAEGMTSS